MNQQPATLIDMTPDQDVRLRESSVGYGIAGLLIIVILFGGLGAWAMMAELNGAVIAPGRVTVESNRKTIQHLDGGIVSEILVEDGDVVTPGQVVMRVSSTVDQATFDATIGKLDELTVRAARLRAERDGLDQIPLPKTIEARITDPEVTRIMLGETGLFEARRSRRDGTETLLRQRIEGYRQQIAGLEGQISSNGRQVDLVLEEHRNLKLLHDKGYATLTRVLALERQAEQLNGQMDALRSQIATVKNSIAETELELTQLERDVQEQVVAELRSVEAEIFNLQKSRVTAEERLKRADIVAPQAGVVLNLAVHTVGGVIAPGQALLDIVPDADALLVEAQVATTDIDKISLGQNSVVRLSAFDQAETPEITGKVEWISADRLVDEVTGQPYYMTRIVIADDQSAERFELVPGMPAEVFIETGHRTAISYFVKPLTDRLARTFVEG